MRAVLSVIRNLTRRIESAENKLECLKEAAEATTRELDGLPKAPNVGKRVENFAVKIADLSEAIQQMKLLRIDCIVELWQWLNEKIQDVNTCQIVFLRYGELKQFGEIAREINFSESTVYRLHRQGLRILEAHAALSDGYEFDRWTESDSI